MCFFIPSMVMLLYFDEHIIRITLFLSAFYVPIFIFLFSIFNSYQISLAFTYFREYLCEIVWFEIFVLFEWVLIIRATRIVRAIVLDNKNKTERALLRERELLETQRKVAVASLNPHFLYNCLTSIMNIDGNPDETINALGQFARYLRDDVDYLKSEGRDLTNFDNELTHTDRYIYLEKMRFKDKLTIKKQFQTRDFMIPKLTLEMLCENSIKHGMPSQGDLTITISTYIKGTKVFVEVSDNGKGFDVSKDIDTYKHTGLENIKVRLQGCGGSLMLSSKEGEGTRAILVLPYLKDADNDN